MGEKLRKQIARWTRPAVLGTVIGSAGMNAFAFAAHTTTVWMTSAAITLGIAIPTLVYALIRVGAAVYIDCHAKPGMGTPHNAGSAGQPGYNHPTATPPARPPCDLAHRNANGAPAGSPQGADHPCVSYVCRPARRRRATGLPKKPARPSAAPRHKHTLFLGDGWVGRPKIHCLRPISPRARRAR